MRFDTVLIDVDDTLFDFRKSSFEALVKAFAEIGVTFTEEDMLKYEVFNDQMWKSYELGEIEKDFIYAELQRITAGAAREIPRRRCHKRRYLRAGAAD